jgi:YhcH/YjgK/YiaL family protein
MIFDRIENAALYYPIHTRFERAFEHIRQMDVENIPAGRYELDGENMYVLVQEYNTRLKEESKWEAHRRYIDLQYVVRGAEGMGYANIHHLQQGEYDAAKDFLPLFGEGDLINLKSGCFVLLFPEDAHMPSMAIENPEPAKKIVIKIAVE